MTDTASDKQPFIISSLCFPQTFSKKPMPAVVDESELQPQVSRIQQEKEAYAQRLKNDEKGKMGTMEIDMEREAGTMFGGDDVAEVIEDNDSEDFEQLDEGDVLVVGAYNTPEVSSIHCYVYQPSVSNFYLQHDNLVSEHCLALEWMNFHPYSPDKQDANIVASATFDPFIEIWDMDVREDSAPIITLGGDEESRVKDQHTAGVLDLSWHKEHRHLLASGSEDTSVKVWDLNTAECAITLNHHSKVVHALSWNPVHSQQLLTCSFDGRACLVDPSDSGQPLAFSYGKNRQSEEIAWRNQHEFAISCNTGHVICFDKRNSSKPLWTFRPHKSECHSLHFCGQGADSLLATCGADGYVHLFDVNAIDANQNQNGTQTQARLYSENKKSALFVTRFHGNSVAVGGQNIVEMTDLRSISQVRDKYSDVFVVSENDLMQDED